MSAGVEIIQTLSKNWIHGEKNMWTRIEKCFNNSLIGDSNRRRRLDAEICSEEPEEDLNIRTMRLCQHLVFRVTKQHIYLISTQLNPKRDELVLVKPTQRCGQALLNVPNVTQNQNWPPRQLQTAHNWDLGERNSLKL